MVRWCIVIEWMVFLRVFLVLICKVMCLLVLCLGLVFCGFGFDVWLNMLVKKLVKFWVLCFVFGVLLKWKFCF